MPELRRDPIVGRWVIIAAERGQRPTDFAPERVEAGGGPCPFCPGSEDRTPPEVYAERPEGGDADGSGWIVRVVSNKFPALQIEGQPDRRAEGIYDKMNGLGAHEVVIETPEHGTELALVPLEQVSAVARAYRARIIDLTLDRRFRYIQIFKNHGAPAGATLEHSHTQLIATPIVPRRVDEEIKGFAQHYELKERCILCDVIHQEIDSQRRVVSESEHFVAVVPFAARFPYEVWVMPKFHGAAFEHLTDDQIDAFAQIFRETLQRIHATLDGPPYNFVLHTAPVNDPKGPHQYHWHFEIMPKVTKVAGFEWGTGFYINPIPPEVAAAQLRSAL
ncbi:MAG: galactose-1-phosphate uridylyltransferase [Candidatus Eisenbacteria bacterium]|uniref:Galactose-1-phosphate uridylyltransferase n=1 Tax=Eiseniibacteriota bacterium TaxID=2212470 RepID=A0A956M038_UNCEI|nr:galactose-1-phosphate uridylyltransferase [Candidatus Eisenbacteria bacterium]